MPRMLTSFSFFKYHGLGNDFILIEGAPETLPPIKTWSKLAQAWCNRHFGIGADGLSFLLPSQVADIKMIIHNEDGSEAQMCGNLVRCIAVYLRDHKNLKKDILTIETKAGVMTCRMDAQTGLVTVDMGEPILEPSRIPTTLGFGQSQCLLQPLSSSAGSYEATAVSMGNPHAVLFVPQLSQVPFEKVGPELEKHPAFPERVNVEFVEVISSSKARVKVWERGAGPTLACGTGACAVVVAGVLTNRLTRKSDIELPGGVLSIEWDELSNRVMMTGPAEFVFVGTVSMPDSVL